MRNTKAKNKMVHAKQGFAEQVAARLIEQIKAGTAPWQRPWVPGQKSLPHNPVSGTQYRGLNRIALMAAGHGDARWMTYRQAVAMGAHVRAGEKGMMVEYWFAAKAKPDDGCPTATGVPKNERAEGDERRRLRVVRSIVFNAEQIDGLPLPDEQNVEAAGCGWGACETVERIVAACGVDVRLDPAQAFYRPSVDAVYIPPKSAFPEASGYYATLLHELGHWTGHSDRLNRDLEGGFGTGRYAKEELRAEIASMILGERTGIGYDPSRHAAYADEWVNVLQSDHREIFRAAADAEKIVTYIDAITAGSEARDHDSGAQHCAM